jgi:hypothetical protein
MFAGLQPEGIMAGNFWRRSGFSRRSFRSLTAMAADRERLQELADACIDLSAKTDDGDTASELLRISYRLLQLADPTLPQWEHGPEFNRELGAV